jgi:two-component system response regulator
MKSFPMVMKMKKNIQCVEILLVEDNPGDIRLTELALRRGKLKNKLNVVKDGIEAIKFLHKEEEYKNSPTPDLILLDLNLPRKNGQEVLKDVKSDNKLKRIPVIILTTSNAEKDIFESYNLNVNAYITKPLDIDKFLEIVSVIENFWLRIVKLPSTLHYKT